MTDIVPHAWLPVPFAVADADAAAVADTLLSEAAASLPGLVNDEQARALAAEVITRLPVHETVMARMWHALGPDATGIIADLSIAPTPQDLESRFAAGFPVAQLQRRIPLDQGLATISFVAPDEQSPRAVLLRVQRVEADQILTVDVLHADLGLIALVLDDVIRMVSAETQPA